MNAFEKSNLYREAAQRLKLANHYAESMKSSHQSLAAASTLMQVTIAAGIAVRKYHNALVAAENKSPPH